MSSLFVKCFLAFAALGFLFPQASVAASAAVGTQESVVGTHWVRYQPTSVEGNLTGCSLTYLAVQKDYVYRHGEATIVNGAIWLTRVNRSIALVLKVGLKSTEQPNANFEMPNFAYIQGSKLNTANSTLDIIDSDEAGYRMYSYAFVDKAASSILADIVLGSKITIKFNRVKGGMDVSVPIDTRVVDSEYMPDLRVNRKLSRKTIEDFGQCATQLINNLKSDIER